MERGSGDDTYWVDATGAGWLDQPVMLHSDRMSMCDMTPEQCAYISQWGLNWYEADHQYGLTVIAFMLVVIVHFAMGALGDLAMPTAARSTVLYRRFQAAVRFLSYRHFRISAFGWYSPSLGVILTGAVGFTFFMGLMLGKKPYYWPNTAEVSYGDSMPIATRAGWMSIALLPFVLVLGAKENPVTVLTRVAYEKLNVFHRWISWAMYVLALVHTFPFIIDHRHRGVMGEEWAHEIFFWSGVVALGAQSWLMFMSIGPLRNRFYEFFKAFHLIMAALFFVFLFIHCDFRLSSWDYLIAAAVLYAVCITASFLRTYFEYGPVPRKARIEALPHNTVKVSILTTSPWAAGQHIFLRFLSSDVHSFTAHPFTIASLPRDPVALAHQREHSAHKHSHEHAHTTPTGRVQHEMSFYVHPRAGFTGRLATLARNHPERSVRVLLDGPYGGMKDRSLASFDRAVIIAGGAGAGFVLPVLEEVLRKINSGSKGAGRGMVGAEVGVRVVLATKSRAQGEWFRDTILELIGGMVAKGLRVEVHITGDDSGEGKGEGAGKRHSGESSDAHEDVEKAPEKRERDIESREASKNLGAVGMRIGRPDTAAIVREATEGWNGSVGVTVCGPEEMLFDVRNATAEAQRRVGKEGLGEVYLYSECFGW